MLADESGVDSFELEMEKHGEKFYISFVGCKGKAAYKDGILILEDMEIKKLDVKIVTPPKEKKESTTEK